MLLLEHCFWIIHCKSLLCLFLSFFLFGSKELFFSVLAEPPDTDAKTTSVWLLSCAHLIVACNFNKIFHLGIGVCFKRHTAMQCFYLKLFFLIQGVFFLFLLRLPWLILSGTHSTAHRATFTININQQSHMFSLFPMHHPNTHKTKMFLVIPREAWFHF